MGITIQPSATSIAAVGKAIANRRDALVRAWTDWIARRPITDIATDRESIERQLRLLVDILSELAGPMRHQANDLWLQASEWYGRCAADRGLATGEIVEEFQHLREILIVELSEVIAALPPRQSLATALRINRSLDRGIAHAVVGYTDALFETMLERRGVPVGSTDVTRSAQDHRLQQLERELRHVRSPERIA